MKIISLQSSALLVIVTFSSFISNKILANQACPGGLPILSGTDSAKELDKTVKTPKCLSSDTSWTPSNIKESDLKIPASYLDQFIESCIQDSELRPNLRLVDINIGLILISFQEHNAFKFIPATWSPQNKNGVYIFRNNVRLKNDGITRTYSPQHIAIQWTQEAKNIDKVSVCPLD